MTLLDILDHFVTISDQFYVLNPCVVTLKYALLYRILLERKTHPCSPHTSPYSLYRESSTPRRVEHFYSKYRKSQTKISKILKKSQKSKKSLKNTNTQTNSSPYAITRIRIFTKFGNLKILSVSPESRVPKPEVQPKFRGLYFYKPYRNAVTVTWWGRRGCINHSLDYLYMCNPLDSSSILRNIGIWNICEFSEWSLVPGDPSALVPGPNQNLANGPWSLGPFGQMSLVPGTPFRVSIISYQYMPARHTLLTSP